MTLCLVLNAVACGGDDDGDNPDPADADGGGGSDGGGGGADSDVTIGGSVSGLEGSGLVLQNNSSDDLTITMNGSFTFAQAVSEGDTYDVTVLTQPSSPRQLCQVSDGAGSTSANDVTNITVNCTRPSAPADGVVFTGDEGREDGGAALWITGGSAETTVLLAENVTRGPVDFGRDGRAAMLNGEQYFVGVDSNDDAELWKTDGTPEGTTRVADINPNGSSDPIELAVANGFVFFLAVTEDEGREPWRSDGTEAGTILLRDIRSGPDGSTNQFAELFSAGDYVLFEAFNEASGSEPWISDGSPDGTEILVDLAEGTGNGGASDFVIFDGQAYFESGGRLWTTDGTEENTVAIDGFDRLTGPSFAQQDGELFALEGAINRAKTLSVFRNGELTVLDIFNPPPFVNESTDGPVATAQGLVFAIGANVWLSDGTEDGSMETSLDLQSIGRLLSVGDTILATAGLEAGPYRVPNDDFSAWIELPAGNVNEILLGRIGDRLLFAAFNRDTGNEIWSTDGTVAGTRLVIDLNSGMSDGIVRD
ncbi:MAG: hypothetical protein AAFV36_00950 [Myxococcota bacterium]